MSDGSVEFKGYSLGNRDAVVISLRTPICGDTVQFPNGDKVAVVKLLERHQQADKYRNLVRWRPRGESNNTPNNKEG